MFRHTLLHTTCGRCPHPDMPQQSTLEPMRAGTGGRRSSLAAGMTHSAQAACVYCRAANHLHTQSDTPFLPVPLLPMLPVPLSSLFHCLQTSSLPNSQSHLYSFPSLPSPLSSPSFPLSSPLPAPALPSPSPPLPLTFWPFSSSVWSHLQKEERTLTGSGGVCACVDCRLLPRPRHTLCWQAQQCCQ